jgi:bifunctional DNase/RNase
VALAVYYNIPIMVRKNMLQDPLEESTRWQFHLSGLLLQPF